MMVDEMPWASIVGLLEARAERIQREQAELNQAAEANILKPVGDNVWGIGAR